MWNLSFTPPQVIEARVLTRLPDSFRSRRRTEWCDANKPGSEIDSFLEGPSFDRAGNLYVSETNTGEVYRYPSEGGRIVARREPFGSVLWPEWQGEGAVRGPDGMAFSADGRLWVAVFGQGDVTVLNPDGSWDRRIPLEGKSPTNVAFGLGGDQRIFVTEDELGQLTVHEVDAVGLELLA